MTKNAKRYLELDKQILNNEKKASRYEGLNYQPLKRDLWLKKAEAARKKQQELNLTEAEEEEINKYYGCYQVFD